MRNKVCFILIIIFMIIFLFACDNPEIFDALGNDGEKSGSNDSNNNNGNNVNAPSPDVKSFSVSNGILLEWNSVDDVDSYLIYKYNNSSCDDSDLLKIYEISGSLNYIDNDIINGQFYYYKLALKRDNVTYEKSNYSYGIASSEIKDNYEDNNDVMNAVKLELNSINNVNIFNYEDGVNNKLIDYDWYYITIPANTSITVDFTNFNYIGEDEIYFNKESSTNVYLNENDSFAFNNFTNESQDYKFLVSVDSSKFNNKFGSYTINVSE